MDKTKQRNGKKGMVLTLQLGDLVRTTLPNSRIGIVIKVENKLIETTFGWATTEYLEKIA